MIRRHHRLNGREFEQAPGDSEGQGSLADCGPWGHEESDMTQRLKKKQSVHCLKKKFSDVAQTIYMYFSATSQKLIRNTKLNS